MNTEFNSAISTLLLVNSNQYSSSDFYLILRNIYTELVMTGITSILSGLPGTRTRSSSDGVDYLLLPKEREISPQTVLAIFIAHGFLHVLIF